MPEAHHEVCRANGVQHDTRRRTPDDPGVPYMPDFVANAGGVVGVVGVEKLGWSRAKAELRVRAIKRRTRELLAAADADAITTEAAARRLAEALLERAESPAFRDTPLPAEP